MNSTFPLKQFQRRYKLLEKWFTKPHYNHNKTVSSKKHGMLLFMDRVERKNGSATDERDLIDEGRCLCALVLMCADHEWSIGHTIEESAY